MRSVDLRFATPPWRGRFATCPALRDLRLKVIRATGVMEICVRGFGGRLGFLGLFKVRNQKYETGKKPERLGNTNDNETVGGKGMSQHGNDAAEKAH